jgi:transposase-like protein
LSLRDLKLVYKADTKALAKSAQLDIEEKWGKKCPKVLWS